jgi:predicted nucleic acid-binding protein
MWSSFMSITELEVRVASLEQKLADLAGKAESPASSNMNAWIDQIHGTFENDSTYRKAAKLGREWRKSHRGAGKSCVRKASRNLRDFQRVPNLRVEDWARP